MGFFNANVTPTAGGLISAINDLKEILAASEKKHDRDKLNSILIFVNKAIRREPNAKHQSKIK